YLGFLHSSDEYKVMALASFGKPAFVQMFREAIHVGKRGELSIDPFDLEARLGPRRERGQAVEERHYDIARSLQVVLEETGVALADWLARETRADDLCLAGGVALNCVMNARLRDRGPFRRIWVQPAAGDAGTALGAALWVDLEERRPVGRSWRMEHVYLGPEY